MGVLLLIKEGRVQKMSKLSPKRRKGKSKSRLSLRYKIYGGILTLVLFSFLYVLTFFNNIKVKSQFHYLFIPEATSPDQVVELLKEQDVLKSNLTFWIMQKIFPLEFPRKGLYRIKSSIGNFMLLYELNNQKPLPYLNYEVPALKIRSHVVSSVCANTGIDEKNFIALLNDSSYVEGIGNFDAESIYCIFLPGTYKIYRRCTPEELFQSLHFAYCRFWNDDRRRAAKNLGFSPEEITILASIVYAETKNIEEMPLIAGVYINRLKKGMRLEADPTLIYATGLHHAKRVYKKHTFFKSKYNTYRNKGLPPGPIGPTPIGVLDATLHPGTHGYLYFCADKDLKGCHIFSESYELHKENAGRFRKVLDKNKIK